MYFAKQGRKDYLDFIKNIPIQTLLFFMGSIFFYGGLTRHATTAKIAIGVLLCLMGAGAAIASSSLFVESIRINLIEPEKARAYQIYPATKSGRRARWEMFVKRRWLRKRALIEVLSVLVIIDVAFSVALTSALFSAFNALHLSARP